MNQQFERTVVAEVMAGLARKKKLLHIITGPRQVGKTTAAGQIAEKWDGEVVSFSADSPLTPIAVKLTQKVNNTLDRGVVGARPAGDNSTSG